jgi:hypothetical protein
MAEGRNDTAVISSGDVGQSVNIRSLISVGDNDSSTVDGRLENGFI